MQESIRGRCESLPPKMRSSLRLRLSALRISSKYVSAGLRGVRKNLLSSAERGVRFVIFVSEDCRVVQILKLGFFIVDGEVEQASLHYKQKRHQRVEGVEQKGCRFLSSGRVSL